MSRTSSATVLIACSIAAGCAPHPVVRSTGSAPASEVRGQAPATAPGTAGASDRVAAPAMDTHWTPWIAIPVPLVDRHSGNASRPEPFRYSFLYPPGASIGAHRYSVDVRITVRVGTEFFLMGNLDSARVQRFDAGSTFVIPAGTWHVEWFETQTLVDMVGVGPRGHDFASPATPRVP